MNDREALVSSASANFSNLLLRVRPHDQYGQCERSRFYYAKVIVDPAVSLMGSNGVGARPNFKTLLPIVLSSSP